MIHASLRIAPAPQKREEVLRILRSLLGPTRVAPGCVSCGFYQDAENENVLCYMEQWETEQDLQRHVQSDDYRKVLALMDLSCEPPEVKFHKISETFGIEYLTRVRRLAG
jgi:quinol monooxygenase YgiN